MLDQENLTGLEQAWLNSSKGDSCAPGSSCRGTLDKDLCKAIVQRFAYTACKEGGAPAKERIGKIGQPSGDIVSRPKQSTTQVCAHPVPWYCVKLLHKSAHATQCTP